jgi:AAA domain, putative AbiEii toxin, Type IV TA system
MTENGNQQRPVRTLTVKNFSVIKEAKLEFGKITVLIGPQASGKSLLCKLAFFFGQIVPEIFYPPQSDKIPAYEEFKRRIRDEFIARFPEDSWKGQGFQISYANEFQIRLMNSSGTNEFGIEFSKGSREFLENRSNYSGPFPKSEDCVYIPTGRAFFSIPNKSLAFLALKNLDWITQRYATEYDADYKSLLNCYQSNLGGQNQFGKLATSILKGRVVHEDGPPLFASTEDSRKRPFEILSSGTLELLPLINSLSNLVGHVRFQYLTTKEVPPVMPTFGVLYIEEPELSVFPSTQNDLVRLLAWLSSISQIGMSYAITTHSPYILSAFNNLIEAAQVAAAKPELKSEVAKLIPEQYWVKSSDLKAYCIHDGNLESIMDEETGLISANYLDSVSDTIGAEFDELLRLGYVES